MSIFDLDFSKDEADIIITPVAWDVTTSYGGGTSLAPEQIRKASTQIDVFDAESPTRPIPKVFMDVAPEWILSSSQNLRDMVVKHKIGSLPISDAVIEQVNAGSERLNDYLYQKTLEVLGQNKIPVSLGGDHSIPFGAIRAMAERFPDFSILHIDAHHDLRKAYQGFTHSHASIFRNIMEAGFAPKKLVQVGIRDYCQEEYQYAKSNPRIVCFYDRSLQRQLLSGSKTWDELCEQITQALGKEVYISFDIDGLDPSLCPNTGTPVPGGLSFSQWLYLLEVLQRSGKKLIGCDLVEVACSGESEWDANVGMRVLFSLCQSLTAPDNCG